MRYFTLVYKLNNRGGSVPLDKKKEEAKNMPQFGKKKPFSAKQKKTQLHRRRETKRTKAELDQVETANRTTEGPHFQIASDPSDEDSGEPLAADVLVKTLESKFDIGDPAAEARRQDRYKLMFAQETIREIEERKTESRQPVCVLSESQLEVSYDDIFGSAQHVDMPCRPSWTYDVDKIKFDAKERRYFNQYVDTLMASTHRHPLSYFELNLETWRQLWRVLEMSDVVVVIADARHPILHFPPSLYRHVVEELKKTLVLVINKIDLVPASVVLAWREYFYTLFPSLHVVLYTAKPGNVTSSNRSDAKGLMSHARSGAKRRMICVGGARQLIRALASVCADDSVLAEWREKLSKFEISEGTVPHISEDSMGACAKESALTIGLVGHPNVGKSSLLNSLVGKKVVSCSRTPGHTKHFQTYFLTPHIRLCDCPGLVFPSHVEKQLQILSGMYPISQVREPYTSIGYLASRLGLELIYRLGLAVEPKSTPPHGDTDNAVCDRRLRAAGCVWSAWDICEAWAEERGYVTAKGGRPDVYRAANHILRLATDGRICLYVRPPGYTESMSRWMCHADLASVVSIQKEGLDHEVPLSSGFAACLSASGSLEESSEDDEVEEEEAAPTNIAKGRNGKRTLLSNNPFNQLRGDGDDDNESTDDEGGEEAVPTSITKGRNGKRSSLSNTPFDQLRGDDNAESDEDSNVGNGE